MAAIAASPNAIVRSDFIVSASDCSAETIVRSSAFVVLELMRTMGKVAGEKKIKADDCRPIVLAQAMPPGRYPLTFPLFVR